MEEMSENPKEMKEREKKHTLSKGREGEVEMRGSNERETSPMSNEEN